MAKVSELAQKFGSGISLNSKILSLALRQPAQMFYLTRLSDKSVRALNRAKLKNFAKEYRRGAYGIATHEWLISTQKPD